MYSYFQSVNGLRSAVMAEEISLKCMTHQRDILEIIQEHSEQLAILGNDGDFLTDGKILLVSPFVRSALDYQKSLSDNVLILPDFSSLDIKKCLAVLESRDGVDLVFDETTRSLLETLGVGLENVEPLIREEYREARDDFSKRLKIKVREDLLEEKVDNDSDNTKNIVQSEESENSENFDIENVDLADIVEQILLSNQNLDCDGEDKDAMRRSVHVG